MLNAVQRTATTGMSTEAGMSGESGSMIREHILATGIQRKVMCLDCSSCLLMLVDLNLLLIICYHKLPHHRVVSRLLEQILKQQIMPTTTTQGH